MRYLFINSVCGVGSTGKICCDTALELIKNGHECCIAYGRGVSPQYFRDKSIKIGNFLSIAWHIFMTRVFDMHGLASTYATKKFVKWAEKYNPDVLWLHNIHGYYINYEILFTWIKTRPQMKVKWTLHDCWTFTGHCSHFTYVSCNKWKTLSCRECPQLIDYPKSILFDNSNGNIKRKQHAFVGVKEMEIITPSQWLANMVKQSFLSNYKIKTIFNTFDKNIFKPTNNNIKCDLGVNDKKILLSVASTWNNKKGMQDIFRLINMLDEDYIYIIIGLTKTQIENFGRELQKSKMEILKEYNIQKRILCKKDNSCINKNSIEKNPNIIIENINGNKLINRNIYTLYHSITGKQFDGNVRGCKYFLYNKLSSAYELAKFYTVADYFINPTLEDTYPSVNVEARMCGTKVISYDTGGCRETLENEI